jgi:glycosyltransferase involved in cell wall biosynthesis
MTSRVRVSHFVGLSGIGGVQKLFSEYIEDAKNNHDFLHKVYTFGGVDNQYKTSFKVYNIVNPINLLKLVTDLIMPNRIVHFYNNLSSFKVAVFLFFIPTNSLIVHERGTVWNISKKNNLVLRFIVWKSLLVLANSNATKAMLEHRHSISPKKIRVVHNGIKPIACKKDENKYTQNLFKIGFIGRFEAHKGIHILIDAMKHLSNYPIELILAGDGALKNRMVERSNCNEKIIFIGRVDKPENFYQMIDLLVVPSIREPFGNICVEAGFCKIPVLAANIDGLPEIIDNGFSGELIDPTDPIKIDDFDVNTIAYPKVVVDPKKLIIIKPLQINPRDLAKRILSLYSNPDRLQKYSVELYKKVVSKYTMKKYTDRINSIYFEVKKKH